MQKLSKPDDYDVLWAQNGSRSDITEKRQEGWLVEIPDREVMNALQYRQDYAIAYMLQNGVPDYSNSYIYYSGQIANVEGVLYRAKSKSQGVHPVTGTNRDNFWEKLSASWPEYLTIKNRIESADPFTQYILKDKPEVITHYTGLGIASSLDKNAKWTFNNSGVTYSYGDNPLVNIPNTPVTEDSDNLDIATTAWVKALLRKEFAKLEIGVGESIISQNSQNPAITKGYGVWVLDCQGKAIVGVSTLTNDPTWTKTVNSTFGAYSVALTLGEMPTHNHYTDSRFNKLTAIANDVYGDVSVRQSTGVSYDYGEMETELGIGAINSKAKSLMTIQDAGGGQAHNNVQPSQTKYIWTRTK